MPCKRARYTGSLPTMQPVLIREQTARAEWAALEMVAGAVGTASGAERAAPLLGPRGPLQRQEEAYGPAVGGAYGPDGSSNGGGGGSGGGSESIIF